MNLLIQIFISFGSLIIAMTVHEFAHGFTAYRLGDPTAKHSGRLTLNPLAHIDLFWTILLPLFLFINTGGRFVFGAAKPVPVNFWALRNPRRDTIWVGLSGPLANFLMAAVVVVLFRFIPFGGFLSFFLSHLIVINIILGVFNLIPIPPLDGSRIVLGLLPYEAAERYTALEPYGIFIVAALMWLGILDHIMNPILKLIFGLLGITY